MFKVSLPAAEQEVEWSGVKIQTEKDLKCSLVMRRFTMMKKIYIFDSLEENLFSRVHM